MNELNKSTNDPIMGIKKTPDWVPSQKRMFLDALSRNALQRFSHRFANVRR